MTGRTAGHMTDCSEEGAVSFFIRYKPTGRFIKADGGEPAEKLAHLKSALSMKEDLFEKIIHRKR